MNGEKEKKLMPRAISFSQDDRTVLHVGFDSGDV